MILAGRRVENRKMSLFAYRLSSCHKRKHPKPGFPGALDVEVPLAELDLWRGPTGTALHGIRGSDLHIGQIEPDRHGTGISTGCIAL